MKNLITPIVLGILLFVAGASGQTPWLDRPLSNWNSGNGVIPNAPRSTASSPTSTMCAPTVRRPESLNDRALTRAGWHLYGPAYTYGQISIITAMASVDGMCRPNQYNGFVFVGTRFAGTLAPVFSEARSDGALSRINLYTPDDLSVEFVRYTSNDPLCCPSQTSYVTYKITTGTRPTVSAEDVETRANCDGPIQTQDNVVSGTVTYRQRSALPPTAVLIVSLIDISRADAAATVIAEQRIETAGKQVPFSFDMAYDRSRIQERNRYAIRAEIRDRDRLLFTTDTNHLVITQGNPRVVDIVVVPVGTGGTRDSSIRGTVTYRQRIALPPNSEITVRLVDSADPNGTPVAENSFSSGNRNVPIPFELSYAQRDINRQRNYELQAEIRSEGRLRFRTPNGQPITLRGNQTANVELVLEPASDGPEPITGRSLSLSKFGTGTLQIEGRSAWLLVSGNVVVTESGDATVSLTRIGGTISFQGKLVFIDDTTARIAVTNSGDADASGEIQIAYSGRNLRNINATSLVLDGQNVTLRF
ncbi:YbaY family lipoprotein [Leptolyngbya sp. 7M]|uniref:YbaY family lipoprotein n=1 Tax=Leptolyngbya sp. 7M TaxID=2812896 RepID=UPI001B8D7018|nr:YbaY family lipoprotein [Leptolyngbya sp. 7M]QYO65773.1 YbaY family lipoprotein [Leptolyngbya sp. 7M]